MILQETTDKANILFNPEDIQERKKLESFSGLLRQGFQFYCPNKQNLVYNLYTRLKRKVKNIKYTPYVKELIEGDLKIKDIPATFKFHTPPLKHQLIALRFAYTFGSFLNLGEPGLGKTKVTLDYIWLMQFKKTLIVCPKTLRFVWEEERDKHRPELKIWVIETTDWDKERLGCHMADIIVVNYDKAVSLESHLEKIGFEFIAVDEGLIKNPSTERTKALTRLGKKIPYRSVMSGTLVNNSPLDVFAPLRFVEPALVGEAFGKFRDEYSLASRHNRFIVIGYKNVPEVKEMLASCSVIMTKAEWLKDLPQKVFHKKYIQMGDQQRDYYNKLAHNYLLQLDNGEEIEVDNPLSVLIKLNQISNGFIYYKDTEETINELYGQESSTRSKARRKTYFFKEQPKAKALIDLIKSSEFNGKDSGDRLHYPGSSSHASNNGESSGYGDGRTSTSGRPGVPETSSGASCETSSGANCKTTSGTGCETNGSDDRLRICSETRNNATHEFHDSYHDERSPKRHNDESSKEPVERHSPNLVFNGNSGRSDLLNYSRKNRRAIIWFNLAAERDIITQSLDRAGISFLVIEGGTNNIGDIVRRFNNDPSIQFLVCQAKTINYGVTIMGTAEEDLEKDIVPEFDPKVSDEIFYSINFSLEVFLQQQDRIHRIGQTRECNYWLLLTNSKIERAIADRLEEKLVCNREILVDIVSSLGDNFLEE